LVLERVEVVLVLERLVDRVLVRLAAVFVLLRLAALFVFDRAAVFALEPDLRLELPDCVRFLAIVYRLPVRRNTPPPVPATEAVKRRRAVPRWWSGGRAWCVRPGSLVHSRFTG
jgi:hypothetical protein